MTPSDVRNPITEYARAQPPALRAICDRLQAEIEKALPAAPSKIWHGSPVWFLGENPIVGYSVKQKRVDLMFWSGQLFDEPNLKAVGKDKAAQVAIQEASSIDLPELRRCLKKAGSIVVDYMEMYRQKREGAGTKPAKSRKRV
jgi:hypothetical protein